MIDRFLTREECRQLALKWRSAEQSPLGEYAVNGIIAATCLDEIRALYAKPLAPDQRAELFRFGMALAAYRWGADATHYDALLQAAPRRSQEGDDNVPRRK